MGPKSYDRCTYKRKAEGRSDIDTEEKREAEIQWSDTTQGMPRNASNHQELRDTWSSFSFWASSRNQPCWHLDFGLLSSRSVKNKSILLWVPKLVICYGSISKLIQSKTKYKRVILKYSQVLRRKKRLIVCGSVFGKQEYEYDSGGAGISSEKGNPFPPTKCIAFLISYLEVMSLNPVKIFLE